MPPVIQPPPSPDTAMYRLHDGADAQTDTFDGHWLAQSRGARLPTWILEAAKSAARSLWWKRLDRELRESPVHLWGETLAEPFSATEHGVAYEIDFKAGYSQGLFLDQRLNRLAVRERVNAGDRVLNTFAYTCGFSVAAALGGAVSTSVDLSRPYLEWGKRNFLLNQRDPANHFFTRGDTQDWLRRWAKSGTAFHGIILDPPTFSRNEKGKVFQVEKDYGGLVELAARVLEPGGWILCCTNCRTLTLPEFRSQIHDGLLAAGRSRFDTRPSAMPPEFTGENYLKSIWVETS